MPVFFRSSEIFPPRTGFFHSMNKALTILTLSISTAVALSASVFAQDATPTPGSATPPPGGRRGMLSPEAQAKMWKEKLNLTDDQAAKVKEIVEKRVEELKSLREDKTTPQQEKRAKFVEAFKAISEEILTVLTPEQQAKFKEEMEKRRAARAAGGAGAPGADAPKPAN
jgi:Spy/CpxP family protein refolding chaperone